MQVALLAHKPERSVLEPMSEAVREEETVVGRTEAC
jgi:hypothetical protein